VKQFEETEFERWLRESANAASRRDVEIQRNAREMLEPMIAQLVERYALARRCQMVLI
jgi:hypothetical protein